MDLKCSKVLIKKTGLLARFFVRNKILVGAFQTNILVSDINIQKLRFFHSRVHIHRNRANIVEAPSPGEFFNISLS
jgi:hypothetical protein